MTSGGDPLGGLSPYDLRHLTEHLGSAGRPDQLHRLLWLTAGGPDDRSVRNAWYAAKERIADLDGFLADLDAAWRAAESGSGAVADRLVHQVRCLLSPRRCGTSPRACRPDSCRCWSTRG